MGYGIIIAKTTIMKTASLWSGIGLRYIGGSINNNQLDPDSKKRVGIFLHQSGNNKRNI
jgi:hypothetical protein